MPRLVRHGALPTQATVAPITFRRATSVAAFISLSAIWIEALRVPAPLLALSYPVVTVAVVSPFVFLVWMWTPMLDVIPAAALSSPLTTAPLSRLALAALAHLLTPEPTVFTPGANVIQTQLPQGLRRRHQLTPPSPKTHYHRTPRPSITLMAFFRAAKTTLTPTVRSTGFQPIAKKPPRQPQRAA